MYGWLITYTDSIPLVIISIYIVQLVIHLFIFYRVAIASESCCVNKNQNYNDVIPSTSQLFFKSVC